MSRNLITQNWLTEGFELRSNDYKSPSFNWNVGSVSAPKSDRDDLADITRHYDFEKIVNELKSREGKLTLPEILTTLNDAVVSGKVKRIKFFLAAPPPDRFGLGIGFTETTWYDDVNRYVLYIDD